MKHLRIMIAVLLALSLFLSGCATEDRTSSVTEKNPVAKALDVLKRRVFTAYLWLERKEP